MWLQGAPILAEARHNQSECLCVLNRVNYLSCLQKCDSIQASLQIRYFLIQARLSSLCIDFHELVLSVSKAA